MVDVAEVMPLLQRAPTVLRAMYGNLPDAWLHASVADEWSAHTVLVHLVQTESHAWIPRIVHLLAHPGSTTPGVDPGGPNPNREVDDLLNEFERLRTRNLKRLNELDMRLEQGIHPVLGPVTTQQILATWAIHDLNHQAQAMAAIASRYRTEVGPFIPNLGILGPPE